MLVYIVRRILWTIPIVLGIVLITFVLFKYVARDPALLYAGKFKSPEQLQALRHEMGIDIPRWFNAQAAAQAWRSNESAGVFVRLTHAAGELFDSQFFKILFFQFPHSIKYHESVWKLFARSAPVSLAIQLPAFVIELGLQLLLALYVASNRGRWPDVTITFLAVLGMSLPALSIYMASQWFFGAYLRLFPVAGWDVWPYWIPFAALPILVTVIGGVGGGTRFYRTVILEEINSDYVRTARAKGVARREVLLSHVMRNVMIPVITNTVTALPGLFLGALILERLFQIPGFGGALVTAVFGQDSSVVMAIVYVTSIAYCLMLLINDILYTVADPRVSLK